MFDPATSERRTRGAQLWPLAELVAPVAPFATPCFTRAFCQEDLVAPGMFDGLSCGAEVR